MRISQKNEDGKGTSHRQPPPQTGSQEISCLGFKFPKSSRILSRNHYHHVMKGGRKMLGATIVIDYRIGRSPCPKLGLTVSRRYGKAYRRNRFKRLAREAFRHTYPHFPLSLEINIAPRYPVTPVTKEAILSDLHQLIHKIQTQNAQS